MSDNWDKYFPSEGMTAKDKRKCRVSCFSLGRWRLPRQLSVINYKFRIGPGVGVGVGAKVGVDVDQEPGAGVGTAPPPLRTPGPSWYSYAEKCRSRLAFQFDATLARHAALSLDEVCNLGLAPVIVFHNA